MNTLNEAQVTNAIRAGVSMLTSDAILPIAGSQTANMANLTQILISIMSGQFVLTPAEGQPQIGQPEQPGQELEATKERRVNSD